MLLYGMLLIIVFSLFNLIALNTNKEILKKISLVTSLFNLTISIYILIIFSYYSLNFLFSLEISEIKDSITATNELILFLLFMFICTIYIYIISTILDIQGDSREKVLDLNIIGKILILYPRIYNIIFFLIFILLFLLDPYILILFITEINVINSLHYGGFNKFEYHLSNIITKTKVKNYYYYVMFFLFQLTFIVLINIHINNWILIQLFNCIIVYANISMINYILRFEFLSLIRTILFLSFFIVCRFMELNLIMFIIGCYDFSVVYNLIYGFTGLIYSFLGLLDVSLISDLCVKGINSLIGFILEFIKGLHQIINKVKFTSKLFDLIKYLVIFVIDILPNNIIRMNINPYDLSGGGSSAGPSGSSTGGPSRPPGGGPSGNPEDGSSVVSFINLNDNHSNFIRSLDNGNWLVSFLGINVSSLNSSWTKIKPTTKVPNSMCYNESVNAFYVTPDATPISVVNTNRYIKYLVMFKGFLKYGNSQRINQFVWAPITLFTETPNVEFNTIGSTSHFWGISPSPLDYDHSFKINNIENVVYYRNTLYNRLNCIITLRNLDNCFKYYENTSYSITFHARSLDHKTQIFMLQLLQDKHPEVFNQIINKDQNNRINGVIWTRTNCKVLGECVRTTLTEMTSVRNTTNRASLSWEDLVSATNDIESVRNLGNGVPLDWMNNARAVAASRFGNNR